MGDLTTQRLPSQTSLLPGQSVGDTQPQRMLKHIVLEHCRECEHPAS
jgi:hypothetical protein